MATEPAAPPAPAPAAGPAPSWRPWWTALAIWLLLVLLAAAALWRLRQDALASEGRDLSVLSLALTDQIARGLQGAEDGLLAVRAELAEGSLPDRGASARHALRTRVALMPLVRRLWLLDRGGHLLAASGDEPVPALAGFLPPLPGLAAGQLAVGRPYLEPGSGIEFVALALRYARAPGNDAGGWIVASVPSASLLGAFAAAAPAPDARMAVFRRDGVRMAGAVVALPALAEPQLAARLARQPGIQVRRFGDGSERLVSFDRLPQFGLGVMLTRSADAVLQGWRLTAQLTAAGSLLLLAVLVAAARVVRRANRRRGEAQQALQAQRLRASKLEALGSLAGGVAHDFNNVLAAIVGFGEMAQEAASPGSAQARHLDRVLQAALRGKALVERILAFGRGGARSAVVFELQPVVEEVLALLSASLRPGLVLERALEAAGARVRGDPTQAFEAVMNLCTNALQAMPEGGRLRVGLVRERVAAQRVLSHSELGRGAWLALSVADEGSGISPGVMERLFEPFFTTRGRDQGTGLGLAVVHGVVTEFGGAIDVRNRPGRGACFTLFLPETAEALASQPAAPAGPVPAGAGQAVLVVDDEPALVALAQEMLQGLGYAPVAMSDAVAALQLLREQPQRFAAVVTDEVMPGLAGTALTAELRRHAPALPVLLVSGFGGPQLAQRAAAAGVTRVLAKPLQRAALA
ncbi:MAG: response regulator, partial [Burkholderiales bacterium]|nr:response regulator [Burkholderiales bacterium]